MEEASNTERTPYLFTSKELDRETGLYYVHHRYYDPRTSVWQRPVSSNYPMNSGFTQRRYVRGIGWHRHPGNEYRAPTGTPVRSPKAGRVTFVGNRGDGYGNVVEVTYGDGRVDRFAHLSGYNVRQGAFISQGTTIGRVGSTGLSTGPHLHFEIIVNGVQENPDTYTNTPRGR